MKNNQKIPVSILADREVFEYLKEKGDERKTRTEAYCDLLDKSLAGFVSPFLRKKAYVLQPNQCHLTFPTSHRSGIGTGLPSVLF